MDKTYIKNMREKAIKASKRAYSPYGGINVGAAVIAKTSLRGFFSIVGGCNVENVSYGATICAERSAIFNSITLGYREIRGLYLYTKEAWKPCGMCLQVMSEFMDAEDPIWIGGENSETEYKLKDLLPQVCSKETYDKLQEK